LSLLFKEKHSLRVFENRLPRRIFEPERDSVVEGWRKVHNVELHNLHISPNIIRTMETTIWVEHVAGMEAKRNV
jgi:hypothetical protein